jgi:hypothetical protein
MPFGETKDKIKYDLNNCPFCGSVLLEMMKRISDKFDEIKARVVSYYVYCDSCGACGPPTLDAEYAASLWNRSIPHPDPIEEAIKRNRNDSK